MESMWGVISSATFDIRRVEGDDDASTQQSNRPGTEAEDREAIVKQVFGEVGTVQEDFSCAVEASRLLLHGRMYVTDLFICFYSNLFGFEKLLKIPFSHINCITKEKTLFIPNAIAVITAKKEYIFRSFWDREEVFLVLKNCHRVSQGLPALEDPKMREKELERQREQERRNSMDVSAAGADQDAASEGGPRGAQRHPLVRVGSALARHFRRGSQDSTVSGRDGGSVAQPAGDNGSESENENSPVAAAAAAADTPSTRPFWRRRLSRGGGSMDSSSAEQPVAAQQQSPAWRSRSVSEMEVELDFGGAGLAGRPGGSGGDVGDESRRGRGGGDGEGDAGGAGAGQAGGVGDDGGGGGGGGDGDGNNVAMLGSGDHGVRPGAEGRSEAASRDARAVPEAQADEEAMPAVSTATAVAAAASAAVIVAATSAAAVVVGDSGDGAAAEGAAPAEAPPEGAERRWSVREERLPAAARPPAGAGAAASSEGATAVAEAASGAAAGTAAATEAGAAEPGVAVPVAGKVLPSPAAGALLNVDQGEAFAAAVAELEQREADSGASRVSLQQDLPCSLTEFFEKFIADSGPHNIVKFHEKKGDWDVRSTPWTEAGTGVGLVRDIRFVHPFTAPIGPNQTRALKAQRCRVFGSSGLVLETGTHLEDIMMADYFQIDDRMVASPDPSGQGVTVSVTVAIRFFKSTMLRRTIETKSLKDSQQWWTNFLDMAKTSLQPPAPPRPAVAPLDEEAMRLQRTSKWMRERRRRRHGQTAVQEAPSHPPAMAVAGRAAGARAGPSKRVPPKRKGCLGLPWLLLGLVLLWELWKYMLFGRELKGVLDSIDTAFAPALAGLDWDDVCLADEAKRQLSQRLMDAYVRNRFFWPTTYLVPGSETLGGPAAFRDAATATAAGTCRMRRRVPRHAVAEEEEREESAAAERAGRSD